LVFIASSSTLIRRSVCILPGSLPPPDPMAACPLGKLQPDGVTQGSGSWGTKTPEDTCVSHACSSPLTFRCNHRKIVEPLLLSKLGFQEAGAQITSRRYWYERLRFSSRR
jgi:hypothetical protein